MQKMHYLYPFICWALTELPDLKKRAHQNEPTSNSSPPKPYLSPSKLHEIHIFYFSEIAKNVQPSNAIIIST
jgi:hypothetical protein